LAASPLTAFVLLFSIATTVASCSQQATTGSSPITAAPSTSQQATPPFESQEAFAWIIAACGGPSLVNGAPNSLLPRASDVKLCITPPGRAGVLVGIYDDQSVSADDAAAMRGPHRYATRQDSEGRTWIFVVEGTDAAPLQTLEHYDFSVH
jgi:hypothetical protein